MELFGQFVNLIIAVSALLLLITLREGLRRTMF